MKKVRNKKIGHLHKCGDCFLTNFSNTSFHHVAWDILFSKMAKFGRQTNHYNSILIQEGHRFKLNLNKW